MLRFWTSFLVVPLTVSSAMEYYCPWEADSRLLVQVSLAVSCAYAFDFCIALVELAHERRLNGREDKEE